MQTVCDELLYILVLAIVCAIMICAGIMCGIRDTLAGIEYELNVHNLHMLYHTRSDNNIIFDDSDLE